jgi:hypothetical protein
MEHSMHLDPTPANTQHPLVCLSPDFQQSLDRTRPHEHLDVRTETLRKQNKWPGHLVYRYLDTDDVVIVPNCWYNQPVAWRVAHMRWHAARYREQHAALEKAGVAVDEPGRGTFYSAEEARQDRLRGLLTMAARMEELANTMEATGIVTN